ncbi:14 kDa proline-rich protein DC2.15-like [Apium graveolens]|uniref:14 kDa proline-rich protein DC2.15-like n=1 Tax=Apium graveolens TaxID=4045 RepID=UPI003D7A300F
MDTKNNVAVTLFLSVNLLFLILISACDTNLSPNIPKPASTPAVPSLPTPTIPAPRTPSTTPTYSNKKCPQDALKLGVCVNVLNLVDVVVGSPPTLPCCSLIQGLVDLEAALCLCTAIRANILGINLNVPVALSLVLNNCGREVPNGFACF